MSYGKTPEQVQEFYREVLRRVSAIPGVERASTGFSVPWRDEQGLGIRFSFAVQGAKRENGLGDRRASFRSASPGFFRTLGVPILEGRDFREGDRDGAERVVIVSQSVAKSLFPGQDPLNRELTWTDPVMKFIGISYEPRRIIGVVPDIDDENIIPNPGMTVFSPSIRKAGGVDCSSAPVRTPIPSSPPSRAPSTKCPPTSPSSEPAHSQTSALRSSPPIVSTP
jgi:hypothetical protein